MKCINLENFDPNDLVFDYPKEGEMSDGTSFFKNRLVFYVRTERPVRCTFLRIHVFRLVFERS